MFNLLPKDTVFFDLFEGLATHAVSCSEHLRRLAINFPKVDNELSRIRQEEHEADNLAHSALERLDRTFITPFDREDIHTLVNELDDVIDIVDALAKRFTLYHVKGIDPLFIKQCEVLVRATATVSEAVQRIRRTTKLTELSDKLIEIHRLESEGDDNHHQAMSNLFAGGIDPLEVLKWKEFFEQVESAIDGCEDVGNTLERIVLKNG